MAESDDSPLPVIKPEETISSMASASDHIDQVRTQIPYALLGAGVAVGLYLLVVWNQGSGKILELAGQRLPNRGVGTQAGTWEIIPWQSHALCCHC